MKLTPSAATTNSGGVSTGSPGTNHRSAAPSPRPIGDARGAAEQRHRRGLGEEEPRHLPGARSDGAHEPDLVGALAHRDPHHGEDADRADDERDARDRADGHRDHVHHVAEDVEHRLLRRDGEVLLAVVAFGEDALHVGLDTLPGLGGRVGEVDLAEVQSG